jgi:hypothetical protein
MKNTQTQTLVYAAAVAALALAVDARPAHAYLDPGTGSYAAQALMAGALVGVFSLRTAFQRVVSRLRRRR